MEKPKEPKTWTEVIEPIAAKFSMAFVANGEAIFNAEGSQAMAALLMDMARKLDNGDEYFVPRHQIDELQKMVKKAFHAGYDKGHESCDPKRRVPDPEKVETEWKNFRLSGISG